jgi:hypothetical protein
MTTSLPDELRQALQQDGGSPVHLVDTETNVSYVIMRAEQYERVKLLFEGQAFDPREFYPLAARSAAAAGWDDPEMDVYNDYDAHRKP